MWYVVSYDISDDRCREELAKLLGRYGRRVQLSVFECYLEDGDVEHVRDAAIRILGKPGNGSVRIYRWCAGCRGASCGVGDIDEADDAAVWIV